MQAIGVLLCCLMLSQVSVASPVADMLANEASLLEKHPSLGELFKRWTGSRDRWIRDVVGVKETADPVCYDEETEKMKEMFRYLDRNRNQLSKILEQTTCKTNKEDTRNQYLHSDSDSRWSELQSALLHLLSPTEPNDDPRKPSLSDSINVLVADEIVRSAKDSLSSRDSPSATENREQCRIDYAGFVEPITNSIINSVIDGLCNSRPIITVLCNQLDKDRPPNLTMPDWGGRMIDAMAKIPTTLSEGPLSWVGAYDLCQKYKVSYFHNETAEQRNFNGKYCRLDMTTNKTETNGTALPPITLQFGVCVPDTCNSHDVKWYISENNTLLKKALQNILKMDITYVYCGMEELDAATDTSLQAGLAITLFFLIMAAIATIYDGFFRKRIMKRRVGINYFLFSKPNDDDDDNNSDEDDDEKVEELNEYVNTTVVGSKKDREELLEDEPLKIRIVNRLEMLFVGCSAYTNFRKLFTIRDKPGDIPVLNGIRYLSFAYVMWGNTYVFGPVYFEAWTTANILGAVPRIMKEFIFQPIINFHLAEDSFLVISGIMVTYWFLRRFEENGNRLSWKSIVYYIVHRYWRLMPVMMMSIMIFTCTYKYAADGPMFPPKDTDGENCRVNWWVDLLMVHNIVMVNAQCFGHAWFVPLVFQLHLAAIVVVIPLVLKPVIGYVMIGVMYVAHIAATAAIATDLRKNRMEDWYNEYLLTPWCRAGPFIIGLAFGIILHKKRHLGIKLHTLAWLGLWLVALVCVLLPAFASYSQYKVGGERWGDDALIAYDVLARSAWGLGVAWIALACHFGHGGVIESFLTWKAWVPLSRLVYTSLLMHGLFIFQWVYTNRLPIYIEPYHMYYALFGHLIYVMIIGLLVSLIWDLPLGTGVEKAIMAKTKFHWIRAGRHPRSNLDAAERRFWNLDESNPTVIDREAMSSGKPAIPDCQYVEVNPKDVAKLGLTIGVGTEDAKGNHHHAENTTVAYVNAAFEKDGGVKVKDEPKQDYDSDGDEYEAAQF